MIYPKNCSCCNDGIIDEKHAICPICGWEDDSVQNSDELFEGGANKQSLYEYRRNHLLATNQWINHVNIDRLTETGLVKAFYTTIDNCIWKYGKDGAYDNVKKLAKTFGISTDNMVMLNQTHTNDIRIVNMCDGGEMVNRPLTRDGYDGMITNEQGLMLCTVEADCVPVYILDPCKRAIGMVHSGWRGTAGIIAANAVKMMVDNYQSDPADIIVVIGPCICKDCYEVGEELIEHFSANYTKEEIDSFFISRNNGKYSLDLIKAIRIALVKCGIRDVNISDTGVCTFESSDLCSWRRDNPVMRSMLTAIMLK